MNRLKLSVLVGAITFSGLALANDVLVIGDESNLIVPTNEDFKKINQAVEYYAAKVRLVEAQKAVRDAVSDNAAGVGVGSSDSSTMPRHLRGTASGDMYIDGRGNAVEVKKEPQAYILTINGVGGNLTAEMMWADSVVQVRRGDTVLGGNWIVASVNKDDVVLDNMGRKVRIGSIPINVSSLME